jgi:hypothetical protein
VQVELRGHARMTITREIAGLVSVRQVIGPQSVCDDFRRISEQLTRRYVG